MSQQQWTAVDAYLNQLFAPPDAALDAALEASSAAGLPEIQISPVQGKLLQLLAQAVGARSILEIGTLGAYSTIWLGRALPSGGRLITLEAEPRHAEVARANLTRAGLDSVVDVRLGRAQETLPQLAAEQWVFDFVFIDADKTGYVDYLGWALRLSRPGALIVADNVVRKGAVIDAEHADADALGIREFNRVLAAEPRVRASILQTVGVKGHDGFAFALVTGDAAR